MIAWPPREGPIVRDRSIDLASNNLTRARHHQPRCHFLSTRSARRGGGPGEALADAESNRRLADRDRAARSASERVLAETGCGRQRRPVWLVCARRDALHARLHSCGRRCAGADDRRLRPRGHGARWGGCTSCRAGAERAAQLQRCLAPRLDVYRREDAAERSRLPSPPAVAFVHSIISHWASHLHAPRPQPTPTPPRPHAPSAHARPPT